MKNYIYAIAILSLFSGCAKEEVKAPVQEKAKVNLENMKLIKGGKFLMGTKEDSYGDKFLHTVEVSDFYIDITEVTNNDNFPMVNISYNEALSYCKKQGKTLPTEAQWEYAARGGMSSKLYPWGDEKNTALLNDRDSNLFKAKEVKSYMPNAYGLYEMSGNVREWVLDSYSKDFYRLSDSKNPINKEVTTMKVTRGGSFDYSNGYPATVAFRSFDNDEAKYDDLGFRCAYIGKEDIKAVTKTKVERKNQKKEKKQKSEKSMLKKTSSNISEAAKTKKDAESLFKW